ncbi:acyl-CoA N-acyltransferase [Hypoxylon rubiginosum]|uniref:Acyl-CoA N-acyltransferase n=1 Tax=Hypoxylon rubiginosum TaxID=110542 RepID=A0ACC0DFF7_9PEZI|nr:acyl-CoA N-acyltransferase [Hypoxylon rubiginosum]
MPLIVLPAQVADIEPIYDVYFAAFQNEPIIDLLYPGGVDRKAHIEGTKLWWAHNTALYTIKCIDTDIGEVVGMATYDVFWRPGKDNGWEKPAGIPWLEGKEKEKCEAVLRPMWDMRDELFGKEHQYIYLSSMATHPDHQRRGVGRLLMQWGINVAEQIGIPMYLESSKPGLRLYESMGFERLTHVRLVHREEVTGRPDEQIPLMMRMPSAAKGLSFKEWADSGYPKSYQVKGTGGQSSPSDSD